MTTTTTRDHYLLRDIYRGAGGDHPEPWQVTYTCACGVEIAMDEEGRSIDMRAEWDAHLDAMETDQ